uniref:Hard-surface inducible protein n=1 Tax=Colletotrichum gloeosporioides TaxID=474922 RepID=Q9UUS7_COLGL|nr:hard-surface inducible protein [Colletotrichum gloeosporioides]
MRKLTSPCPILDLPRPRRLLSGSGEPIPTVARQTIPFASGPAKSTGLASLRTRWLPSLPLRASVKAELLFLFGSGRRAMLEKPRTLLFIANIRKIETENDDIIRFTYSSYYDLDCTFNQQTGKLFVRMKSPQEHTAKDLGDFALAAMIDRHSHNFNPPESTPNKAETEFRVPQPQPSLPHILAPMPFPRTLFETLTHTAAFINQAGYLAKYAEESFNTMDAEYHLREQRLDAAKEKIRDLNEHVKKLEGEVAKGTSQIGTLEQSIKDIVKAARDKEAELLKEIARLKRQGKAHDDEDHKVIKHLEKQVSDLHAEVSDLKIMLATTGSELSATRALLAVEKKRKGELEARYRTLEAEHDHSEKELRKLRAQNSQLSLEKESLKQKLSDLQKQLEDATNDLKTVESDRDSKNLALKKAEEERDQARSELTKKTLALEVAEREGASVRQKLEDDLDLMRRQKEDAIELIKPKEQKEQDHEKLDKKRQEEEANYRKKHEEEDADYRKKHEEEDANYRQNHEEEDGKKDKLYEKTKQDYADHLAQDEKDYNARLAFEASLRRPNRGTGSAVV